MNIEEIVRGQAQTAKEAARRLAVTPSPVKDAALRAMADALEKNAAAILAAVKDREHLRMRVWERGSGETLACGTGACATLVATVLNGLCERKAILELNGGSLTVEWDPETGHVFQEGPAEFVFDTDYE